MKKLFKNLISDIKKTFLALSTTFFLTAIWLVIVVGIVYLLRKVSLSVETIGNYTILILIITFIPLVFVFVKIKTKSKDKSKLELKIK